MKVCSVCLRCYEDAALSCSEENHAQLTEARAGNCEVIPNYRLEVLQEVSPTEEVYRAVNTILKKPYLIKIVPPGAFDAASRKRFLSEAQGLASIIHPNVARVFEAGTLADGSLYVVTEFFTAQTLRECLTHVGAPSEVTALTITRQAAEGLEALHTAGALHRSIRPENIILTSDAENSFLIKLQNIDFGAIRQQQVNSAPEQNLGDLRYFSPEQCAAEEADAQTDVYSLGVVLYETLAGRVPFDAPYADALIAKQIKETPPPVKINSFDIRMLLTHTLTDALQKQTRTRLKSANAFARRIRHIEQLATHSSTPPPAVAYPAAMNKAAVVFTPPAKKAKTGRLSKAKTIVENPVIAESIENSAPVEVETIVNNSLAVKARTALEESAAVETPAVIENTAEAAPLVEEPAAVEVRTMTEEAPPVEISAVFETVPALEMQTSAENPAIAESIEIQPALEAAAFAENPPVAETQPVVEAAATENQAIDEELPLEENPAPVEALPSEENPAISASEGADESLTEEPVLAETRTLFEEAPVVIENAVEAAPSAADSIPFETRALVEENPLAAEARTTAEEIPAVETPAVIEILTAVEGSTFIENSPAVEMQTIIEDSEERAPVEDLTAAEVQTAAESLVSIETPETLAENSVEAEARATFEEEVLVETPPAFNESVSAETHSEDLISVETRIEDSVSLAAEPDIEIVAPAEARAAAEEEPVLFEARPVAEDTVLPETQSENLIPVENEPEIESSIRIETRPVIEEEVAIEAEASEAAAPVLKDYTTTKLPPIETVVDKSLPENIVITEISPIFSLKDGFLDIHKTSEPVLIDWEQPDDVPTTTQALNIKKKETADAEFGSEKDFARDDEDDIIDVGDADAPVDSASERGQARRDYAAERAVFSYDDSGTSWHLPEWNLPDKRKILTGAGLLGVFVLAVGGTLLSRQFLTARDGRQTTAQSSSSGKTVPKAAEPVKAPETEKPASARPEAVPASNPVSADNTELPELPAYQPRETDAKTAAPVVPENRNKKRVLKEAVEKLEKTVQTKTAADETPVFDKRGDTKSSLAKKPAVKNPVSTSTKNDIFTRPRIVKNPQF